MKRNRLNLFATLFAIVLLSACGGLNKMKDASSDISYSVSPSPLELKGETVEVTIETKFPPKYFNKKAILTATPVLVYDGGEAAFPSVTLQGESVEANNKVISSEGDSYTYTGSVDYAEGMMVSSLEMRMSAEIGDQTVEFPVTKVADGLVITQTLLEKEPKVILASDNFERVIPETYLADIHYVINRSYVRGSELRQDDVENFVEAIRAAKEAENKKFKKAKVSAYASPDGEYDFNDELSEDRQASSNRYLTRELKKADVEQADQEEFFELLSTAEDWEGFKEKLKESSVQDKELILRVLSMYSDPEVREREIRNMSEAFEDLKETVLPALRRAKLSVEVNVEGFTDEELKDFAQNKPDTLKVEEILYAATLVDDMDDKLAIYKAAADKFPNDYRTKNNVGFVQYKMGDYDAAKASFEAAKNVDDNDIVNNNLAAVAFVDGDVEDAEEMFSASMGAGDAVNYNLGIIKIMQGDYKAAVNYFGNKPSFNAALAQLLNEEYDAALATLGKVEDDDAMVYYLKAVAGARQGKEDVVLNNLRTAVGKDADLKSYAKKDLEFKDYKDTDSFTSIVG
jgi:tetratricopeptide (TPR) repeat protein